MKEKVTLNRFIEAFNECGRNKQFTYEGLTALFQFLTELEEETGGEIEFDPIGICCEFKEIDLKEAAIIAGMPENTDGEELIQELNKVFPIVISVKEKDEIKRVIIYE